MRVEIWMWIDLEEWNTFASRRCCSSSTFDAYTSIEYMFRWGTCTSSKLLKDFRIFQKNDAILCEAMKKVVCMKFIVSKRKRKYAIHLEGKQPKMKWKRSKTISYIPLGYSGYCGSCCNKLKSGHRQATDEFRLGRIGSERSHTENVKSKWFLGLVCRACVAELMFRLCLAFVGRIRNCFSALGICSFRFYSSLELCVEWTIFVNINLFRFFLPSASCLRSHSRSACSSTATFDFIFYLGEWVCFYRYFEHALFCSNVWGCVRSVPFENGYIVVLCLLWNVLNICKNPLFQFLLMRQFSKRSQNDE